MKEDLKKGYGLGRKQTLEKCCQAVLDYGENLLSKRQREELLALMTLYAHMHKSAIEHGKSKKNGQ